MAVFIMIITMSMLCLRVARTNCVSDLQTDKAAVKVLALFQF